MDNVFNNYGENVLFLNNILNLKEQYQKFTILFADDEPANYKKLCENLIKDFYCTYELTKKFDVSSNIVSMYIDFENTIVNPLIERGIINVSK